MKKQKLSWSLRWENFICSPRWKLEDWINGLIDYSIDKQLNKNIYFLDKQGNELEYESTTAANYQKGMIVYLDPAGKKRFLIKRIEVSLDCTAWYIYGKIVK